MQFKKIGGEQKLNINLEELGWNSWFEKEYHENNPEGVPCRIVEQHKNSYIVQNETGVFKAKLSGKMVYEVEFAAVGDWVSVTGGESDEFRIVEYIYSRKSKISRKVAGKKSVEQIIASNIDYLFIVISLNDDFNLRRAERYLAAAYESGAEPVIVLSKSDVCEERDEKIGEIRKIAKDVDVICTTVFEKDGLKELECYLEKGSTAALVGSSGVGKSSIINRLIGKEVMKTGSIREDDSKGRHTTTSRELIHLENGANIIDTPGMRELQLWDAEEGIEILFEDIAELEKMCRFKDCTHSGEPGCAVSEAVLSGQIDKKRYESYLKLKKEAYFMEERKEKSLARIEKDKWKKIGMFQKEIYKSTGKK